MSEEKVISELEELLKNRYDNEITTSNLFDNIDFVLKKIANYNKKTPI